MDEEWKWIKIIIKIDWDLFSNKQTILLLLGLVLRKGEKNNFMLLIRITMDQL